MDCPYDRYILWYISHFPSISIENDVMATVGELGSLKIYWSTLSEVTQVTKKKTLTDQVEDVSFFHVNDLVGAAGLLVKREGGENQKGKRQGTLGFHFSIMLNGQRAKHG